MKISSNQIITFIIALLIGIALTSFVIRDKEDNSVMEKETVGESVEEVTEDADVIEDEITAPTPVTNNNSAVVATKPSTEFVSGTCSTGLSAYKDSKLNAVVVNWSPCASDNFQFYKLVKSSKNSNPTYPADPVAFSSSNKNAANFVDKTVAARTTYYYRMCVVQRLGAVNCSGVASVSF